MSQTLNKILLIGHLGADPEVRHLPGDDGRIVVNMTVATTESWHDKGSGERKEETEWHRVVLYNQPAQFAAEYLKKGAKVYIEGRNKTRKWQDQQNVERYTTEIIAAEIKAL